MTQIKTKPFDLKEALEGKPVVTKDGREVKIAGYNKDATVDSKLMGWVDAKSCSWRKDGSRANWGNENDDLFMLCEEQEIDKTGLKDFSLIEHKLMAFWLGRNTEMKYEDYSKILKTNYDNTGN